MIKEERGKDLDSITEIITVLENDAGLKKLWEDYKNKHSYSNKVTYMHVINALKFIQKEII